jgi:hypothetical protein
MPRAIFQRQSEPMSRLVALPALPKQKPPPLVAVSKIQGSIEQSRNAQSSPLQRGHAAGFVDHATNATEIVAEVLRVRA